MRKDNEEAAISASFEADSERPYIRNQPIANASRYANLKIRG
jgi:hypothetical protein